MGRLVKTHNGEVVVAHNFVATPDYTLLVADYVGGNTPPHGWVYYPDDLEATDFAAAWVQPTGAQDAYALGAIVAHKGTRWRSRVAGNVWEPGVSGWADATTDIPEWLQPTGAHDSYVIGAIVRHNADLWASLVGANVWEPGVSGWRRTALVAPGEDAPVLEWVQPTGSDDAYPLGAKVKHNGKTWVSNYANNVWEPGVFGWSEVA